MVIVDDAGSTSADVRRQLTLNRLSKLVELRLHNSSFTFVEISLIQISPLFLHHFLVLIHILLAKHGWIVRLHPFKIARAALSRLKLGSSTCRLVICKFVVLR